MELLSVKNNHAAGFSQWLLTKSANNMSLLLLKLAVKPKKPIFLFPECFPPVCNADKFSQAQALGNPAKIGGYAGL